MKHSLKKFDPKRVADLETEMWKAYYSHRFIKLFLLLIKLFEEQFSVNKFVAIRLAYHSGTAAKTFRRKGETEQVGRSLAKFYAVINQHSIEKFDPAVVAKAELEWWLVHRYPKKYKQSLANALSLGMSVLYSVPASSLELYGIKRAAAMNIRDQARHLTHTEPDWDQISTELLDSYSALHRAVV